MTNPSPRQLREMIERYRADLEEVNRRIRIVEWLARGQRPTRKPRSA